ncbi:hypothetical protein GTY87_32360 [Streptomyces sp. SID7813]|uniref:Uncharacterized protein n=1 Tax=Streptomyces coelicolor (strain ATCC BAA-471 / A3(2) / M145) TaxID=100226 RepID=O86497_STRCO|nr:hypothetical protein [Streptomyces sp. SID7813]QFI46144.1 hypothetical protein FQ762_32690 [Streptomyces coelicolor A3(2)]THA93264.1 hypothetical protein E6R61_16220 [Streptomyces sp. LRa12]CAA20277.1 hypothetical protein SC10H5.05 [Streptomyces coelicolor A3(2)]
MIRACRRGGEVGYGNDRPTGDRTRRRDVR